MAEENRNEMNAIVSILGDVLVELQSQRQENAENTRSIISAFDRGFTAMLDRLTSIEKSVEQLKEHSQRLEALERRMDRLEGKN